MKKCMAIFLIVSIVITAFSVTIGMAEEINGEFAPSTAYRLTQIKYYFETNTDIVDEKYDEQGRVIEFRQKSGADVLIVKIEYDKNGKMKSMTTQYDGSKNKTIYYYTHNEDGQISAMKRKSDYSYLDGDEMYYRYKVNKSGQIEQYTRTYNFSSDKDTYTFTYYDNGAIKSRTNYEKKTTYFSYNNEEGLIYAKSPDGTSVYKYEKIKHDATENELIKMLNYEFIFNNR